MYSNNISEQTGSIGGAYHFSGVCGINSTFTQSVRWAYEDVATYTRDAMYMHSNTIATREWQSYSHLWRGVALSGIYCLQGDGWITGSYWGLATIAT